MSAAKSGGGNYDHLIKLLLIGDSGESLMLANAIGCRKVGSCLNELHRRREELLASSFLR